MRRRETQKISDILKQAVNESAYDRKLKETRLIENWEKVLGPGVARSTSSIYIRNKTLFVHIESPVIRHELFMMRSRILASLNESVGGVVIHNILFK
jgi:predicted nucleic acid-binding Zn ribbon protein